MAYLDDIIIFSQNEQEHLKHIEIIFLGQSLCHCALIEKLITFFCSNFLAIKGHSKGQLS